MRHIPPVPLLSIEAHSGSFVLVRASVFGLFASLSLSALADTYGRKFFLVVSLVANGVALLIVGVSYSLFGLVSLRILPAIFDVSGSVTYAVVSDMVPPETFVGVYTYFGAAFGGGLLLGPVVALGALAIEARHLPFLVCAICTLINLAFLMHRLPETLRWRERVQNAKDDMDEENAVEAAAAVAAAAPDLPAAASAPSAPSPLESQPIAGAKSNPFDFPASPSPPAAAAAPPAVASKLESSDLLVAPIPFVPSQPRDWRSVLRVAAVNPFATLKMAWSTRVLARLCSSLFLHTLGDGFLVAVIFLYGKEMWNWGATENAGLVVYGGISSMVVMVWVAPRMQKRWGEKRTMHISQAAAILQLIVVALSPIGWIVYPVATIGAANFLWTPALRAQISRQVGPEAQGALQGAVATVVSTASILSSAMGSALFSVLADHDGPLYWPGLTFLVAAFFNVLAVLVVVGVDTRGIAKIDVDTPRKGQEANKQADTEAERAHSAHLIQSPLRRSNSLLNEIEETRYGEWVE